MKKKILLNEIEIPDLPELSEMESFYNMWLAEKIFLHRAYLGQNGLFVVMSHNKSVTEALRQMKEVLSLNQYIYPIAVSDEGIFYIGSEEKQQIEDLDEFLTCLCQATRAKKFYPESVDVDEILDGEYTATSENVAVLDFGTITRVATVLVPLENNDRPNPNIKTDEDGHRYIKKYSTYKIGGKVDTGLVADEKWFPLSEMDPMALAFKAAFGGCFGAHKFALDKIKSGFLYLLTCGCGGILPAVDILMITFGNYSYTDVIYSETSRGLARRTETIYVDKLKNPFTGIGLAAVSLLFGQILTNTLYAFLLKTILTLLMAGK